MGGCDLESLGGLGGVVRQELLVQWGLSRRGVLVGEVDDGGGGGGGGRAGGFGCCPGEGSRRKGRPSRGASGEAGEVGGREEGRAEDVAGGRAAGSLAGDEGRAVDEAAEISGGHGWRGEGRRRVAWMASGPRRLFAFFGPWPKLVSGRPTPTNGFRLSTAPC
jgi:hypothetical protein